MSFLKTFCAIFFAIIGGGLIAWGGGVLTIMIIQATHPLVGLFIAVAMLSLIITFISKAEK